MTAAKQAPQELSVRRTSALHMVLSMDPTTTTTTTTLPPILVQNETLLAPLLEDYVEDYDEEEEDDEDEEEEDTLPQMPWQVADHDAEAIAVAVASGATALEAWLTAGGDDRCLLTNGGKNKYHIAPRPVSSRAIVRGSCTCNAPTPAAYAAAQALFERWQRRVVSSASSSGLSASRALHEALADTMEEQRQRLAASLQVPPGTHIALVPSGSDAEYLPLAMARTLRPDARSIFNVVTQSKEIGTGSSPAAGGQYFSTHAPLMGALSSSPQTTHSQTWLTGFEPSRPECPEIHTCSIPARQPCGTPLDTARVTSETIDDFMHSSNDHHNDNNEKDDSVVTIVHGVFGGKTGLRDAVLPGSTFAWKNERRVLTSLGVVDACQGRFSVDELQSWLDQDSIVLFTASKFYQAPPFCGAVIIPKGLADELNQVSTVPASLHSMFAPGGLGAFLTDKELPDCLHSWKQALNQQQQQPPPLQALSSVCNTGVNIGLALRWEAGLAEMEPLAQVPDATRQEAIASWAQAVTQLIQDQDNWLHAWCVQRSIISIRVRRRSRSTSSAEQDEWLNVSQLRQVYRFMSLDLVEHLQLLADHDEQWTESERDVLSVPIHLGQPVDVAEDFAILRMALGSQSLQQYLCDTQDSTTTTTTTLCPTLQEDQVAVQKLALIAQHLDSFQHREAQQQPQQSS